MTHPFHRLTNSNLHTSGMARRPIWLTASMGLVIAAAMLAVGLGSQAAHPASAAAPAVSQCNNVAATTAGQGLECTVTIINYVNADGTLDDTTPSTVTVTTCSGEAGPV